MGSATPIAMVMAFSIVYSPEAVEHLAALPKAVQELVLDKVEEQQGHEPALPKAHGNPREAGKHSEPIVAPSERAPWLAGEPKNSFTEQKHWACHGTERPRRARGGRWFSSSYPIVYDDLGLGGGNGSRSDADMSDEERPPGQSDPPAASPGDEAASHPAPAAKKSHRVNAPPVPREIAAPIRKTEYRPARNGICWCGSGKKYKKCHMASDGG
jgi:hypothetical protein